MIFLELVFYLFGEKIVINPSILEMTRKTPKATNAVSGF